MLGTLNGALEVRGISLAPKDIVAAKKEGRHCLYFSGNGVPLTQDWISVEDELRYIRIFFQLGIRMMHLTYQRRNMIGDGCAVSFQCPQIIPAEVQTVAVIHIVRADENRKWPPPLLRLHHVIGRARRGPRFPAVET